MMEGAVEYVVAERAVATYDALAVVVEERGFGVVQTDLRHLTLVFRAGGGARSDHLTVMCAVLDAGHGLSKLVLVGVDPGDGSFIGLGDWPVSLFADVERRLRDEARKRGSGDLVRP
jgi:hypothetical protein